MRHACATDGNHAAIRDGLRAAGLWVWDTHRVGGGFPDLLVWRGGKAHGFDVAGPGFVLLELKDGTLPPSRRTLTPLEEAFHAGCPGAVHVVECLEDAFDVLGIPACSARRVPPASARSTRSTRRNFDADGGGKGSGGGKP
jgi:hypothetical protein